MPIFFAGGNTDSLARFVFISLLVLSAAALLLLLRARRHNEAIVRHLYAQLPAESVYKLRARGVTRVTASELVLLVGDHLREQQQLLNANFSHYILERDAALQPLSESINNWQLLRAELKALEDQFKADRRSGL